MTKLILIMIAVPMFSTVRQQKPDLLERPVNMKIYAAEILESVMNRVGVETGQTIVFNVLQLTPYKATARNYHNVTVREVLDDQLSGTPFRYMLNRKKKQLQIYQLPANGSGKLQL